MAKLSPIPFRVPIADRQGLIDRNWQQFFLALLDRVGGVGDAPTNFELQADDAQELGAQTVAFVHVLEQELRGVQQLPVTIPVSQEALEAFAPRSEVLGMELDLAPRSESLAPDFILGEIT